MGITFTLINNASGPAGAAAQAVTNLNNTVTAAAKSITDGGQKIMTGIAAVAVTVGLLAGPFAAAVSKSMEFNFQLTRAGAIARASTEEIAQLKEMAFALGEATQFTSTEVAKTNVVLSQAGFVVQQQLQLLPGLTDLATAGVIGLDYAASIASDTLFQFGLQARDMGRVADVIVMAANKSNISVENFGNAMKYLGPTAKAFGIELEEAAGYIELMGNSGMRGSIGTRAFGTSLANLSHPTREASALMKQLGFSAYDQQGKFVGLIEMTRRLQRAVSGLRDEDRDRAISTIFGNEAIQEMLQLLYLEFTAIENGTEVIYKGADALEYFTRMNKEAKGVAADVAREMRDNLKTDVILMQSALETLAIRIGDIQEGPLRAITQTLASIFKHLGHLVDTRVGQWLVGFAASAAAVASALVILGFAATVLVPVLWSMVTAGAALAVTYAPFIITIGAIVGLYVLLRRAVIEFDNALNGGKNLSGFMGILQNVGGVMMSVLQIWRSWNGETYTLSEQMHQTLENLGILEFVLDLATWIVRIKEFFLGIGDAVSVTFAVVQEVVGYVKESFSGLIETLESVGIPMGKLVGDLSLFRMLGQGVGMIISTLAAPFIFLGGVIMLVVDAVSFLIAHFKEIVAFVPGLNLLVAGIQALIPDEEKTDLKSNVSRNAPVKTSSRFNLATVAARQNDILSNFGGSSQLPSRDTAGPELTAAGKQEITVNLMLEQEKLATQVLEFAERQRARR